MGVMVSTMNTMEQKMHLGGNAKLGCEDKHIEKRGSNGRKLMQLAPYFG